MNALNVSRTEQRIIPFWYRGSLNVDPNKGNGRQTDLEKDICEFERWQRARSSEVQN